MTRISAVSLACSLIFMAVGQCTAQVERAVRGAILGGADGITFSSTGGGISIQSSTRDGVRTIKATEKGEKTEIVIDQDKAITMKVTRSYSADNIEELEKNHPDLIMYLQSVPKKVGNASVELSLNVTTDYEADSEDDLKEKHPEIYERFKKYSKNRGLDIRGVERMMAIPALEIPEIEIVPPARIRGRMKDIEDLREEMEEKIEDLRKKAAKRLEIDPEDIIKIEKVEGKDTAKAKAKSTDKKESKSSDKSEAKSSDKKSDAKSEKKSKRAIDKNDT